MTTNKSATPPPTPKQAATQERAAKLAKSGTPQGSTPAQQRARNSAASGGRRR